MALHYVLGVCASKTNTPADVPFFQCCEIHYYASEIFTKSRLDTVILYRTNLYYHNFNVEHFNQYWFYQLMATIIYSLLLHNTDRSIFLLSSSIQSYSLILLQLHETQTLFLLLRDISSASGAWEGVVLDRGRITSPLLKVYLLHG